MSLSPLLSSLWDIIRRSDLLKLILGGAITMGAGFLDIKGELRSIKERQIEQAEITKERYSQQLMKDSVQDTKIDAMVQSINDSAKELRSDIRDLRNDLSTKRK